MKRNEMIEWCKRSPDMWDVIIIGGGATGLGSAVDAASRGYKTLLLEQHDFAKGSSSRSTKLIHGGLRYLKQGNIPLVMEGLKERGLLFQNAPHLVSHLPFLIPNYRWWEGALYACGLKVYDLLAGTLGIEKSYSLSFEETKTKLPTLISEHLRGSNVYYDGQFDDARLAITLAQTAVDAGAVLVNYMPVVQLLKKNGLIQGVEALDLESGETHQLHAKVVINATGPFSDAIRQLDQPEATEMIAPSQGVHIVLDRSFFPSDLALLIPETSDGRILFFIPWHDHLMIGTTDTAVATASLEPKALSQEIDFLLSYASTYLTRKPKRSDILSVFAGIRPLARKSTHKSTAKLARSHVIRTEKSGLITICGGKWTTYRRMAEEVVDQAIITGGLDKRTCKTKQLRLHGYKEKTIDPYGSDAHQLNDLIKEAPELGEPLHPKLPCTSAQVIWAVRAEMARTVEDVLSRRTRSLLLNARATIEIAPRVAQLMAFELGKDVRWETEQVQLFNKVAQNYLC